MTETKYGKYIVTRPRDKDIEQWSDIRKGSVYVDDEIVEVFDSFWDSPMNMSRPFPLLNSISLFQLNFYLLLELSLNSRW